MKIPAGEQVAIIGIGCRFPGGVRDAESYWQLLRDGRDAIGEIPRDRWRFEDFYDASGTAPGKCAARWGGFLDDVAGFDAEFFHLGAKEASHLDPQQRLILEVTLEALEDASLPAEKLKGSAASVYVGIYADDYRQMHLQRPCSIDSYSGTGTIHCMAANRISYLLDLTGPSMAIDASCASSLVAVHLACESLARFESDIAIAGAVSLMLAPTSMLAAAKVVTMAGDGRSKTFDSRADGIVRGEGCGVVILKRLADALAAGDPIRAVIDGTAVNQDGRSNGITAPNPAAQEAVIRRALARAGVGSEEIDYVEAHGTGTPLGDPIEIEALSRVFRHPVAVGSVKTNLGHLEAAAGMAGLLKAVLAIQAGVIPPHLHLQKLNPAVAELAGGIDIPAAPREWLKRGTHRRAGVSAFSLGGTNAHVVLSSAPTGTKPERPKGPHGPYLLPLSAASREALQERAHRTADWLAASESADLSEVCYTAAIRRSHFRHRLAVAAESTSDAAAQLLHRLETPEPSEAPSAGDPVFVFTGQATCWNGTGHELFECDPYFRASLTQSDEFLQQQAGWSVIQKLADPHGLDQHPVAQSAILALQLAMTDSLAARDIRPGAVIGHSLGEVAAACVAGVLRREDAFRMTVVRGESAGSMAGRGAMAALQLDVRKAQALIGGRAGLSIAAINSDTSTVISGDSVAMAELRREADREGIVWVPLRTDCAFHSPQMLPLLAPFVRAIRWLESKPPQCPMYSTVTGRRVHAALGPAHWGRNLADPVRFADAVKDAIQSGYHSYLEIGPRPVLTPHIAGLLENSGVAGSVIPLLRKDKSEWAAVLEVIGQLYEKGHEVLWDSFYPEPRRLAPLPAYPWQRKRYWLEEAAASSTSERTWSSTEEDERCFHGSPDGPVLSIAGYLQLMAQALGAKGDRHSVEFRRLEIQSPVVRSPDSELTVRTELTPQPDGSFSVRVSHRQGVNSSWHDNASAETHVLSRDAIDQETRWNPSAVQARLENTEALRESTGLDAIASLWLSSSEILAEVSVDRTESVALSHLCLSIGVLLCTRQGTPVFAVGFERASLHPPGAARWIYAAIQEETEQECMLEVAGYDVGGRKIVECHGLRLRRTRSRLLYEVAWKPLPPLFSQRWPAVRDQISRAVRASGPEDNTYQRAQKLIDALCAQYAADILRRVYPSRRTGCSARYRHLWSALAQMALEAIDGQCVDEILERLKLEHPALAPEMELLVRCARELPDVFAERANPLDVLFGSDTAWRIYRESPFARHWNDVIRNVVMEVIRGHGSSKVRIIEVGAGTGGTTAALLSHLACEDVEYWFTDVSGVFLNRARAEFERFDFLRYSVFDVNRDPRRQALTESFDIVLAANSIHTAPDVPRALANLRKLCNPGGVLVLLEGTGNLRWADLTFGATEGWFREDGGRPLMNPEIWVQMLTDAGWEEASTIARGAGGLAVVLVARAPANQRRGWWALIGDRGGAVGRIAATLEANSQLAVIGGTLAETLAAQTTEPIAVLDCRYAACASRAAPHNAAELCGLAVELAQAMVSRQWTNMPRLWLITQSARSPRSPGELVQSSIHGLGRVLFAEHPELAGGVIDLEGITDATIERLRNFVQYPGTDDWISISADSVSAARLERISPPAAPSRRPTLRGDATYLITGGLGGIGVELAEWILRQGARKVVLINRSDHPEALPRLRRLQETGAEIVVRQADVSDAKEVSCILDEIASSSPPLRGIVHAAGVVHDGVISQLHMRDLREVLEPKVEGAWNLHRLSEQMPLDLFWLFSSAATWIGLTGLAAYTAANAFLGGLAAYRRGRGLTAQTIDWGGWRATGMALRVGDEREHQWSARGINLMEPEIAMGALGQALHCTSTRVGIVDVNWKRFLNSFPPGGIPALYESFRTHALEKSVPMSESGANLLKDLREAAVAERPEIFYGFLREQLSKLVSGELPRRLPPDQSIVELGVDSLMAVEVRNGLSAAFGIALPVTAVFDYPTPDELLRHAAGLCSLELPDSQMHYGAVACD